ncbi:peroxiredoxin family protein [Micromonospora globbae]|uniref:peroxiredoxin family protein n=1 Tax=Micromonospora globbae TaxID=1894969 RepID=UPI00341B2490
MVLAAAAGVLAVIALYLVFRGANAPTAQAAGGGGKYPYAVGQPASGQAPEFTLASSADGQVSLSSLRGKTVLLYFQEGLMCQPCWDQISDLEAHAAEVKAAGVDEIISITTDPVDLIARKAADMRLSTPLLSDPNLAVSRTYHANEYGMMGTSRDGHSFILVKPDGSIGWRADYGGAPKYTMFVPTADLLADIKAGTGATR